MFRGGGGSKWMDDLEEDAEGKQRKEKEQKFVEGSIECVAMIDETTFVSGGDSGCVTTELCLLHPH